MQVRRLVLLTFVPVLLAGAAALGGLAIVALRAAITVGEPEGWLMAWTLAFVVGLPLLLPVLALARWAPSRIWEGKPRGRDNFSRSPAHRGSP